MGYADSEYQADCCCTYEYAAGEIYEYAFVLLGAIGFAGIVMFISAAVKNNVLTLLLSLTVVYGPMMIAEYLPYEMQKALDLIPLVGSSTDIFRTNTFSILGSLSGHHIYLLQFLS